MLNAYAHIATDSDEISFRKKLVLLVSLACCVCGFLWGLLYYWYLGPGLTMVLPWIFVVGVGSTILLSHQVKNYYYLIYALIIGIVVIPTSIQWSLGSMHDSGMVMLWSFLGPVGAVLFLNKKHGVIWTIIYLTLLIITVLLKPQFSNDAFEATDTFRNIFYILNTIAPTTVIFGAFVWYLSEKEKAEQALIEGKTELELKNEQVRQQNLIIEESLNQKEVLLKEIHHRVKNNLQLVSGLMELQGKQSRDDRIKEIMDEGQNRIKSMALIHQQLYESENLDQIDFAQYIDTLIQDISVMLQTEANQIKISLDAPEFHLNIDTAVPLGLILNEVIINAFKHAFPDGRVGQISISVIRSKDDFEMRISDDGIGLPEGFDIKKTDSLGLKLVRGLSRQIGGNCEFVDKNGTTAIIKFKKA